MSNITPILDRGFWLHGGRGIYVLMFKDIRIAAFTNKERARGVQFFLNENPKYAAAPKLLRVLENIANEKYLGTGEQIAAVKAAIAAAKGGA